MKKTETEISFVIQIRAIWWVCKKRCVFLIKKYYTLSAEDRVWTLTRVCWPHSNLQLIQCSTRPQSGWYTWYGREQEKWWNQTYTESEHFGHMYRYSIHYRYIQIQSNYTVSKSRFETGSVSNLYRCPRYFRYRLPEFSVSKYVCNIGRVYSTDSIHDLIQICDEPLKSVGSFTYNCRQFFSNKICLFLRPDRLCDDKRSLDKLSATGISKDGNFSTFPATTFFPVFPSFIQFGRQGRVKIARVFLV